MARARQVLPIVEPLAYWLRWGLVPYEENGGCAWLPLGCIVALEWLGDAKSGAAYGCVTAHVSTCVNV